MNNNRHFAIKRQGQEGDEESNWPTTDEEASTVLTLFIIAVATAILTAIFIYA